MSGSVAVATELVNERAWRIPAPGLCDYVDGYAGFRQVGVEPARHRGLPSRALTLIFTLDDPLVIAEHPDPHQPGGTFDTIVGGLHSRPAIISHDGRQSGIQLGLSPFGARALLNMPASELTGIDVPADQVLGPLAGEIQDRLRSAPSWPLRFVILDEVLLTRANAAYRHASVSDEVSHAWRHLLQAGGNVGIGELAAETGWTDRHLRAKFRAEIGLSPKGAARVTRFDRAKRILQRRATAGAAPGLADVAASCGYFDQAHLDREFGLLAGCSPTSWLAEEFRNLQATAA